MSGFGPEAILMDILSGALEVVGSQLMEQILGPSQTDQDLSQLLAGISSISQGLTEVQNQINQLSEWSTFVTNSTETQTDENCVLNCWAKYQILVNGSASDYSSNLQTLLDWINNTSDGVSGAPQSESLSAAVSNLARAYAGTSNVTPPLIAQWITLQLNNIYSAPAPQNPPSNTLWQIHQNIKDYLARIFAIQAQAYFMMSIAYQYYTQKGNQKAAQAFQGDMQQMIQAMSTGATGQPSQMQTYQSWMPQWMLQIDSMSNVISDLTVQPIGWTQPPGTAACSWVPQPFYCAISLAQPPANICPTGQVVFLEQASYSSFPVIWNSGFSEPNAGALNVALMTPPQPFAADYLSVGPAVNLGSSLPVGSLFWLVPQPNGSFQLFSCGDNNGLGATGLPPKEIGCYWSGNPSWELVSTYPYQTPLLNVADQANPNGQQLWIVPSWYGGPNGAAAPPPNCESVLMYFGNPWPPPSEPGDQPGPSAPLLSYSVPFNAELQNSGVDASAFVGCTPPTSQGLVVLQNPGYPPSSSNDIWVTQWLLYFPGPAIEVASGLPNLLTQDIDQPLLSQPWPGGQMIAIGGTNQNPAIDPSMSPLAVQSAGNVFFFNNTDGNISVASSDNPQSIKTGTIAPGTASSACQVSNQTSGLSGISYTAQGAGSIEGNVIVCPSESQVVIISGSAGAPTLSQDPVVVSSGQAIYWINNSMGNESAQGGVAVQSTDNPQSFQCGIVPQGKTHAAVVLTNSTSAPVSIPYTVAGTGSGSVSGTVYVLPSTA